MSGKIEVIKNRYNKHQIDLGMDVSEDSFFSQIRADANHNSPLIATWNVSFLTDGTDGKLVITLPQSITSQISANTGYMDLKRVSGGVSLSVFSRPVEVVFIGSVTA